MRRRRLVVGGAAVAVLLTGGLFGAATAVPGTEPPVPVVAPPGDVGPYVAAMDEAHRDGLRVWIEADLVKRWRAGPAAFASGLGAIARAARPPGVVGVKIADELGYHDGLDSADRVTAFLDAAATALRRAVPGVRILVDMVVPALGCLPGPDAAAPGPAGCTAAADLGYPQLSLDAVGGYLARHDIDVLDLSTGLLDAGTYADWGSSLDGAQTAAWTEAARRGWPALVTLQARKALAHPGNDTDPPSVVAAALTAYVDIPRRYGATAIDIWTWRQHYQGDTYRLLDPGLRGNALWAGLVDRHRTGARLFTHFSPHSVEVDMATDLHLLARAFPDVFVAAGTG